MKNNKIKIICTVGPSSFNEDILRKFEAREVSLIRINLSHVPLDEIENYIVFLKKFNIPIAIDTEGAQVRTGIVGKKLIYFNTGEIVNIHRSKMICDKNNIYLTPSGVIDLFESGDLLSLDFNSVLLRVEDVSKLSNSNYIKTRVLIEGEVGNNKGVHCDNLTNKLPPFSDKDLRAVELAKKHNVIYFTLSFMNNKNDVIKFKSIYPESIAYAKIESLSGVNNVLEILNNADGILIDRGDLSREIPIQKIPLTQKILINEANKSRKDVFIASNLLETMADELKPSRAEANDIVNSIIDGVTGFVLTKETAVGKYPVETVNMLSNLADQASVAMSISVKKKNDYTQSLNLSELKKMNYIKNNDSVSLLINPHGGKLINRIIGSDDKMKIDWENLSKLEVDEKILMDMEQIGIGGYSPLEGFLCKKDFESVIKKMRLNDGTPWTIPIILSITKEEKEKITLGEKIAIVSKTDKEIYGAMDIEDVYTYSKSEYAENVYGTLDLKHPGVQMLNEYGEYIIGGKIFLKKINNNNQYAHYNMTPKHLRNIFESLGWSKVVGFHTRNVIHRSHEFIQMNALKKSGCDGLLIHPVIGLKKKGDFNSEIIIKSYEIMLKEYYKKNKVIFCTFSSYPRYAGPREAVFTAICRKNYGCSHFIVGRDHSGVGNYYDSMASQKIFEKFSDIGMELEFSEEIGYSKKLQRYANVEECKGEELMKISGTEARQMLNSKVKPPSWFMRSSISQFIIDKLSEGKKVFVE